jgi:hypothetical protein
MMLKSKQDWCTGRRFLDAPVPLRGWGDLALRLAVVVGLLGSIIALAYVGYQLVGDASYVSMLAVAYALVALSRVRGIR